MDNKTVEGTGNQLSLNLCCDGGRSVPVIPCLRCGVCCTRYQVQVGLVEAHRIADGLGIGWKEFEEMYLDQHWPESLSFFLRRLSGICIFLHQREDDGKASCLIHQFRPTVCREWMPSLYRRLCREEFSRYWGLVVSPLEQIEGPEEKLRDFYAFLAASTGE